MVEEIVPPEQPRQEAERTKWMAYFVATILAFIAGFVVAYIFYV